MRLSIGIVLAATLASCARSTPAPAGSTAVHPDYDKSGHLTRLSSDSDGDGKVDTWGYMDGARVVRVEVDEDGDGKIDRWEYYGEPDAADSSQTSAVSSSLSTQDSALSTDKRQNRQASLSRIERSAAHDGKVTRWEYYDHGVLRRVEEDTDGDGRIDKWQTFVGSAVSMIALDTHGRGKPDRRLVYDEDGSLNRIEVDPDGSGAFQVAKP